MNIITTEIATNTKVKTIQASVAHNRKSHKRFIAQYYNSRRRFREGRLPMLSLTIAVSTRDLDNNLEEGYWHKVTE